MDRWSDIMINKVAFVGMGALGLMYGEVVHLNGDGCELEYIMDPKRIDKYKDTVYSINDKNYQFKLTDCNNAKEADLLIVSVKYTGLKAALDVMANSIGDNTIVMSVMNGISSEAIIKERFPNAHVIHSVAQGMDCMKIGNTVSYTKMGEIFIGAKDKADEVYVKEVADFFEKIKMPYVLEENILFRMWSKFMLNVGINQTCMVYGIGYGKALEKGEANRTLMAAFREVVAIANAEGINLSEKEINQYIGILKTLKPDNVPSMAQDRINKNPCEVDMFAGAVMEIGRKHGILTPTNEYLYERAKEIESEYI